MKKLFLTLFAALLLAASGPELASRTFNEVTGAKTQVNLAQAYHWHRHCRNYRRGYRRCRPVWRTRCFWRPGYGRICRRIFVGRRCYGGWGGRPRCYRHRHAHPGWHGHR